MRGIKARAVPAIRLIQLNSQCTEKVRIYILGLRPCADGCACRDLDHVLELIEGSQTGSVIRRTLRNGEVESQLEEAKHALKKATDKFRVSIFITLS